MTDQEVAERTAEIKRIFAELNITGEMRAAASISANVGMGSSNVDVAQIKPGENSVSD